MADTFFGFATLLSGTNDDEGGGGPSEDEYDALNDETFGNVGDDLDWEEEHEQLAEITEKNRRHKDEDLDLEASLSQLVLEDSDQMVSGIREALSWSLAELAPSTSRADAAPHLLNGQPYNAVGSLPPMKSVCTVEELERSLRNQHRPQGEGEQGGGGMLDHVMEMLQQSGAGTGQGKQQTSFFQPRFPPVILQRPPGLQAPVPLPFAPPAQRLINQQQKQQSQHQLLNQMNQQQINQLNQQQAQQQHQLMSQQQPQQMQQQLNQQSHNQLKNAPQQQTQQQQQQMNQLNQQQQQQQLNQLSQQQQINQMNQQQQQQQLNQLNQQLGQQPHQLMNQQPMMGGMMHGPQMMMGPRMMGPPPGIGGAPRQQFHPGIGGPGPGGPGPFGPQQGSGPFQQFGMPMNMPPQQVMHGNHQPQSLQSIEQNMVGQQKQQQQQMQNQQKQQQMGPMMNQQQQQSQMQMNHQSQLIQQQQPQLQLNHHQQPQPSQQKPQLNDGGKGGRPMNNMNVYPNKPNLSSQNLVQMIQNTHPMLQNNHGHFNSSYHNASHHPVLNRGGYFNGGNGNNALFHNGSLIFQNQSQTQQLRNNGGDYAMGSDGRAVNGQVERWKSFDGMNGGMMKERGDPDDEYAGLMSNREKQWLINIQMLQLNTGTPYIDDFYYTVFLDRQTKKEKEGVKEAHKANQQNHPFYSSGKPEGPVHRDRHNSGRHNSTGDESGQAPRTYVPTQFENSLGKLQCGSVTAPRKIIDVELVQATEGTTGTTTSSATSSTAGPGRERRALSDGSASVAASSSGLTSISDGVKLGSDQVPREVRRTKQLLLDIEALYCILLRLEEMNDPLAIANAVILKEREEKQKQAEQAHQPSSEESGVRIGLPSAGVGPTPTTARNLLDENREELTAKLMAGLLHEDRLTAFMGVRKGKTLLQRVLARVPATNARLRDVWPRILRGLAAHARRDVREDRLLATYHGPFRRYLQQSSGWRPLAELCAALEEGFREAAVGVRPASRATPTPHRCPLHLALSTPLTLSCISTMFVKADELVRTSEAGEPGAALWATFVRGLARSLRSAPPASAPAQPLTAAFLAAHLAALADVGARDDVVARGEIVADALVRFLC